MTHCILKNKYYISSYLSKVNTKLITSIVFLGLFFFSCKKEETVFENNTIPPYSEIPTVQVQNYVNRLFIDLIGREPVDLEMAAEVSALENADLSETSRLALITKLMTDTTFVEGDSTYKKAYYVNIYEYTKARLIEGASDAEIESERGIILFAALNDSLNGDFTSYQRNIREAKKLKDIMDCRWDYQSGQIGIREVYDRMIDNAIYDLINMNAFNYINATFDDLFYRYPTEAEFNQAFQIIEYNSPAVIFNEVAINEGQYLDILLNSEEYNEGMIRWCYLALLAREPSTQETYSLIQDFRTSSNLQNIQKYILKSDEYAGFD